MIQLLRYLKQYRKDAVLTPVLVGLETVGELCLTLIIGRFIDELSNAGTTMGTIWSYGLRLLLVALVCLIFGTISGLMSTKAAAGLSKNLREETFCRIQDFSFTNIDKFSTNSLVTRMTTDVINVQNAVMMILRVAAKAPIAIVRAGNGLFHQLADRAGLRYCDPGPVSLPDGDRPGDPSYFSSGIQDL